jgi:hypothetical protein
MQSIPLSNGTTRENLVTIGDSHPDEGSWQARMKVGDFLDACSENGKFSNDIAMAFIVSIYSLWEENYRIKIAKEVGKKKNTIKSELMGDVRTIRNCIVHENGIFREEPPLLKSLNWQLSPGPLIISSEMFKELINKINFMTVTFDMEDA